MMLSLRMMLNIGLKSKFKPHSPFHHRPEKTIINQMGFKLLLYRICIRDVLWLEPPAPKVLVGAEHISNPDVAPFWFMVWYDMVWYGITNDVCPVPRLKRKHLWVALAFCGYKEIFSKKSTKTTTLIEDFTYKNHLCLKLCSNRTDIVNPSPLQCVRWSTCHRKRQM